MQLQDKKTQLQDIKTQLQDKKTQLQDIKTQLQDKKTQLQDIKTQLQARRESQHTTFDEYMRNCHVHLQQNFKLGEKAVFTKGYTRVEGNFYPKRILPWPAFDSLCQQHLKVIREAFTEKRLFPAEIVTQYQGYDIAERPATDKRTVVRFDNNVTSAITRVFHQLQKLPNICKKYQFSSIQFLNSPREYNNETKEFQLSDSDKELDDEELPPCIPTRLKKQVASKRIVQYRRIIPYENTFRIRADRHKSIAFVSDFEAAHKVAAEYVKEAVLKETLFAEVIRQTSSKKSRADVDKDRLRAEEHIATAMVQVFHYMVNSGTTYGRVTAAECSLFIYFDRDDPQTLYCHACVPGEDVGNLSAEGWHDEIHCTALAQTIAFLLLSLESDALQGALLDAFLKDVDNTASSSSKNPDFISTAAPASRRVPLRPSSSRPPESLDSINEIEDEPDAELPPVRAALESVKRKGGPPESSSDNNVPTSPLTRQYCTQACLLGLKQGFKLNNSCPNVLLHRNAAGGGACHPLVVENFHGLIHKRLRKELYRNCHQIKT
ncbi:hypothetical protein E4U21_002333 [Claviceps maximensis]|nr:hypothetical protein E4U21_002333 [Claviceps maximensis]